MRIAITAFFRGSAFSGALPQVAVNLSRVLVGLGHEVEFIIPMDSDDWFIDCKELASMCPRVKLQNGMSLKSYNLLIEVVWFLPPDVRKQLALKTVMFYHYPSVFYDIEGSVYPVGTLTRSFQGIDAVWTWSHFKKTDFEYLELLTRCPVFTLPFFWDPVFCDTYMKESGTLGSGRYEGPNEIVICESNESNTSNCTLPMTILSEIYKKTEGGVKWTVINGDTLIKRDFFVSNILKNLHVCGTEEKPIADLSGNFTKRVRLPDLLGRPSVIVSHQRFRPIKYMLLDALWVGLPLIHNCELLKDISGGAFYNLNRVGEALLGWDSVCNKTLGNVDKTMLLNLWGPTIARASLPALLEKTLSYKASSVSAIRVAFFDMWVDFQPEHNLVLAALMAKGVSVELNQKNPNLIIFGPFGEENKKSMWSGIKKIFYTGECIEPVVRDDIVLNIGFRRVATENYFRFPIWMTELNWFNQDPTLVKNPVPLPLDMLGKRAELTGRSKFCIFVTSNPTSSQRNTVFNTVCRYKNVDSAGRLFTNSDPVAGGQGGAGGQRQKIEYYQKYKFAIVCENQASEGYVTEKLLHAKLAGCVPIYWGDPLVNLEFNSSAFLNVSDYKTVDDLLNKIKALDTDDLAWSELANQPLIKDISKFKDRLSGLADTIVKAVSKPALGSSTQTTEVGSSGVTSHEEFTKFLQGEFVKPVNPVTLQTDQSKYVFEPLENESNNVIISCCNSRFVGSAVKLALSSPVPIYIWTIDVKEEEKELLRRAGVKLIYGFDTKWFPNGWTDFWNMNHYAWKPLLLSLANQCFKAGTNVLYLDSGIEVTNKLDAVWGHISADDIFVCSQDHKMRVWSHPTFCSMLKMTEDELNAQQYSANIVGFKVGGKYKQLFTDAFELAKNKDIIVGNKWFQYSKECFGHRHDQSILSLLGLRAGVKTHSIEKFADGTSHVFCERNGFPFYVHRSLWKFVVPIAENIEEVYLVNLDHRADRLQKFDLAHPYLKQTINRVSAVYGNKLTLDAGLAKLFANNDFKWKKGVIGCALSHYNIWKDLCKNEMRNSIMVLEDDAVLVPQFMSKWRAIAHLMPEDTDIVFLGGVLPPNKQMLPHVTESVNPAFARVSRLNMGGQMRRYFHFCTYSYIITNKGAAKLCKLIAERGIFTSIDHMMVNHGDGLLNIYFTTPLLAGCFQDEDPTYQNADFNDFNRVDKFDSEIWNNKECFSPEEVKEALAGGSRAKFVYFEMGQKNCIEQDWLEELFGPIEWVSHTDDLKAGKYIVYYQHTTPVKLIEGWVNRHMDSKLFLYHASDENLQADISIYNHNGIIGVFRNYWRPEAAALTKVIHLPLGYLNGKGSGDDSRQIKDRPYTWSFAGAMDRPGRREVLKSLEDIGIPFKLHCTPTWNSSSNLGTEDYVKMLKDSKIVPCLQGFHNVECYRFYEAMEHGAIPIVPLDANNSYANIFKGVAQPPILAVKDTSMLPNVIKTISQNVEVLEKISQDTRNWWLGYKIYLRKFISAKLSGSI